jgi:hypothetical protein
MLLFRWRAKQNECLESRLFAIFRNKEHTRGVQDKWQVSGSGLANQKAKKWHANESISEIRNWRRTPEYEDVLVDSKRLRK